MKKLFLSIILLCISASIFSQDFEVPSNAEFKTKEDYIKHEKDIIKAVDWLINTPVNSQASKRKAVNAYLIKWLTGSPSVSIALSEDIVTFSNCGDCLIVFMGAWAKYVIETKDKNNQLKGNLSGVQAVIKFYKKNESDLAKSKEVQKYIKLEKKGKLEEFIKSKI